MRADSPEKEPVRSPYDAIVRQVLVLLLFGLSVLACCFADLHRGRTNFLAGQDCAEWIWDRGSRLCASVSLPAKGHEKYERSRFYLVDDKVEVPYFVDKNARNKDDPYFIENKNRHHPFDVTSGRPVKKGSNVSKSLSRFLKDDHKKVAEWLDKEQSKKLIERGRQERRKAYDLITSSGRCGGVGDVTEAGAPCGLLLTGGDYGVVGECHSFVVKANKVLGQHGGCEDPDGLRRVLWYAFYLGQVLQVAGFGAAAFATCRFCRTALLECPALESQTYALHFAFYAEVVSFVIDLVLLGGFDFLVAPAVGKVGTSGGDQTAERVIHQLYPSVPVERDTKRPTLRSRATFLATYAVYILLIHAVLRSDRASSAAGTEEPEKPPLDDGHPTLVRRPSVSSNRTGSTPTPVASRPRFVSSRFGNGQRDRFRDAPREAGPGWLSPPPMFFSNVEEERRTRLEEARRHAFGSGRAPRPNSFAGP